MNLDDQPRNADARHNLLWRTPAQNTGKRHAGALLLLVAVWLVLCGPLLTGREVVAFRDAGYLYYPLWQYMDEIEQNGELPLWNPLDNGGRPLAADLSSAAFYPGRLIFRLRFMSFDARFGWYLALHVLLAAIATYHVGLRLKANRAGALLAAIGYAFGGPILFQVSNPIYVVGAAWLPYALFGALAGLTGARQGWLTIGVVATSMMFLGGDPQNAYHILVIAAALTAFALVRGWLNRKEVNAPGIRPLPVLRRAVIFVAAFAGMCAVQILPSLEWASYSDRSSSLQVASVWDLIRVGHPTMNERDDWDESDSERRPRLSGLMTRPQPGSHADQIYQFSQPPWTVAELALPNISGRPFPQHQRWIQALPGADRMWQPSLFLGLAILVFALGRLTFRRGRIGPDPGSEQKATSPDPVADLTPGNGTGIPGVDHLIPVALRWIAVWFLLGAMGWYGPVWLGREILATAGVPLARSSEIAEPVGGVYWLMVTLLPGYRQFRYPAKLMVLSSLALCLLAAGGATDWMNDPGSNSRRLKRILAVVMALAATTAALALFVPDWLPPAPPDPVWGPLLVERISGDIVRSSAQALAISVALWWIVQVHLRRVEPDHVAVRTRSLGARLLQQPCSIGLVVVLIHVVDIVLANRWLAPAVEARVFHEAVATRYSLRTVSGHPYPVVAYEPPAAEQDTFLSIYERVWRESGFDRTSSPDRLAEVVRAERVWSLPKHHLRIPAISYHSFSSIEPRPGIASFNSMVRVTGDGVRWKWSETRANRFAIQVEAESGAVVEWLPARISGWRCRLERHRTTAESESRRNSDWGGADDGLVELPPGIWNVAWEYRPTSYAFGRWLSIATLLAFALEKGTGVFFRKRRGGSGTIEDHWR